MDHRAVTSTDLVRAYEANPRTSKAIASRLQELTNEREPYDYADLQRIIVEENARHESRYDYHREVGNG
jgi:hypothetical protein